ncbi:related to Kinesin-7a motor protein [Pseudozyma flocculosa]|uniref:Related to Kinesin-7a motor protein n=1 Tax=Pseudozyma flocculosa TaxID=84751 RepID=A0A5C3EWB1_9BASI|nr:related to Kinesin-7a motor protein [Pseudozyma flocculosa]
MFLFRAGLAQPRPDSNAASPFTRPISTTTTTITTTPTTTTAATATTDNAAPSPATSATIPTTIDSADPSPSDGPAPHASSGDGSDGGNDDNDDTSDSDRHDSSNSNSARSQQPSPLPEPTKERRASTAASASASAGTKPLRQGSSLGIIAAARSAFPAKMSAAQPPIPESESTSSMLSSASNDTPTPTTSAPATPKKRSSSSATTPKKAKLSISAKSTPRKVFSLKPSSSSLGDLDRAPPRQNVVVCVRMRPSKEADPADQTEPIWSLDQQQNQIVPTEHHPSLSKRAGSSSANAALPATASTTDLGDDNPSSSTYKFQFDKLLLGDDTTDDMYDSQIAPVVKAAMDGYNGTVFAYGQTGSGKTHTMSGTDAEPGVIPRAVQQVFKTIEQEPGREFLLRVSYLEIYNETLKDLLAPLGAAGGVTEGMRPASPTKGGSTHSAGSSQSSSLRIVEDQKSSRVVITGLREEIVTDPTTVLDLIQKGQEARHVGATDWNERSSRSHCVFQVTIESRAKAEGGASEGKKGGAEVRVSQLNLIDLAGSERAASQVERRKEGAFINKSLLTLGTVIAKLTEPTALGASSSDLHIPYRDSKLTRILQTSLSGNARIAVICTLSPDVKHAVETLSTLKFGKRCKMVVTSAKKGTSMDDKALLQKYRKELDALRAKLEAGTPAIKAPAEADEDALASSRESRQKLDALNEERERAQKEVMEMEKKRGDLRGQIDHLTRLILTSQSVAQERRESDAAAGTNADGTPRKRNFSGMERRGPRLSDIHSFSGRALISQSPSLDVLSSTPTLSGSKPFELEAELAALRKQLQQQIESRQALVAAHQAELTSRDAKEKELEEVIRMNEEELDEAELAFDRLKADRDEARKVALKEQELAREHKRAWLEEQEANRLLKLVAQSRGADADDGWKQQIEALNARLEQKTTETEELRTGLEAATAAKDEERAAAQRLREELQALKAKTGDDDPQAEFQDLVNGGQRTITESLREKEEALAERERHLEEARLDLERQNADLEAKQSSSRPLPVPLGGAPHAQQLDDLEAALSIAQAQNQDLADQVSQLRTALSDAEAAQTRSSRTESKLAEVQMELEGSKSQVAKLQAQLEAERAKPSEASARTSRPLPRRGASWRHRPPSGGSVREYRRYQPASEDDVFTGNSGAPAGHRSSVLGYKAIFDGMDSAKSSSASSSHHRAEREEIERLNAVIQSQRAIMSDLEKSVASWKSRLKAQADLIHKLASSSGGAGGGGVVGSGGFANITPPMQDGELPSPVRSRPLGEVQPVASPTKFSTQFESSRSRFAGGAPFDSPESTSSPRYGGGGGGGRDYSTLPRSGKDQPYYGAHTYNRPPSTIGLGVMPGSPTKVSSSSTPVSSLWSHQQQPSPLPPPPSSPSAAANPSARGAGRRRKPRMTIENELLALKATPRVESSRTRFLVDEKDEEPVGLRAKTSSAAYYI